MYQSSNYSYTFASKRITGNSNPKELIIKDVDLGTIVLDTMIEVKGNSAIALLAISLTDKPIVVGGGETPSDPMNRDSAKYSYIYTDPTLPDSIQLNIHASDSYQYPIYEAVPFASVILYRGQFSPYLSYPFKYGFCDFWFDISDAKSGASIQAIDPDNFIGYSIGLSNGAGNLGGNYTSPTSYKFSAVLLKFADPNETDDFKKNRYHDLVLTQTSW
jgi:hypothetical protein